MNTNLLRYAVKDSHGKKIATYRVFEQDKDNALEIINNFCCYEDGLIPQPWFGNIKKPEILILGVNPSFTKDDQEDYKKDESKEFSNFLERNLDLERRDNNINWLINSDSNLAKWWKKFFGINNNDKMKKKIESLSDQIGILNYYGYNATNINDDIELESHIYLLDNLKEIFKNVKVIVLLWKAKYNNKWMSIINEMGFGRIPVYYANVKNSRYPRFIDSQNLLNGKTDYFEDIINNLKK